MGAATGVRLHGVSWCYREWAKGIRVCVCTASVCVYVCMLYAGCAVSPQHTTPCRPPHTRHLSCAVCYVLIDKYAYCAVLCVLVGCTVSPRPRYICLPCADLQLTYCAPMIPCARRLCDQLQAPVQQAPLRPSHPHSSRCPHHPHPPPLQDP